MNNAEHKIALFIDFENIAIGVTDAKYKKFEVELLLERLLEKGKIVVKRAYCDWERVGGAGRTAIGTPFVNPVD